ncbi:TPA: tail fiber assembly protein [Yersinia enterocolitica]|uniref:tail fiber assembly protein n=1 Tax=Yersinia enterocolitica TaxID=630 RepID=UPI00028193B4|nr:tail fiber assembly protein [Yersinia enterocolitica]AJI83319.1 caudovirales tail fiber assembly family protein [Yersinia enterocolitica]EKA26108.1 tail fiber protein [Yersinia enterocolitica subsp. enterocolitica WA-314]KGA69157.1 caudovirales tail fiber assembly family protein [Yersinia enterocolitica]KGA75772.1 caudovirales tail fiber assembly family protein [Yersinia enterocolitica]PNM13124.1 tail fiber assembly protein [Yersinia enterocolitica]
MTKYSLDIAVAQLGQDGLSITEGWIAVYSASPDSREYIGVNNEYLPMGVGLPARGYADAPILPARADKAVRRNADGTVWEIVADLRGKVAYSTETGQPEEVTTIGELPDTLTLLAPLTIYDKWNGSKWVTDKALQQAAAIQEAEEKKTQLLNAAAAKIAPLQDAVDTGMATNDDKAQLTAWKTYRVLLSRIDTSKPEDIVLPELPQ